MEAVSVDTEGTGVILGKLLPWGVESIEKNLLPQDRYCDVSITHMPSLIVEDRMFKTRKY